MSVSYVCNASSAEYVCTDALKSEIVYMPTANMLLAANINFWTGWLHVASKIEYDSKANQISSVPCQQMSVIWTILAWPTAVGAEADFSSATTNRQHWTTQQMYNAVHNGMWHDGSQTSTYPDGNPEFADNVEPVCIYCLTFVKAFQWFT